MKNFQFRLNLVLRLRQRIAEQEEQRLIRLFGARTVIDNEREQLASTRREGVTAQDKALRTGSAASELGFWNQWNQAIEVCDESLLRQLRAMEMEIASQEARYLAARKEWQKLDYLRAEAKLAWQIEQHRGEQKMNDEAALARFRSASDRQT